MRAALAPTPFSISHGGSKTEGHSYLKAHWTHKWDSWCWQSSGLSVGALVGTPTHGFSMWLLGLVGWVPRASVQTRRGNKGGRESGSENCLLWPSPQKLYIFATFLHSKEITNAGSYSEGEEFDFTFWWEEYQRFFWTCFETILYVIPVPPTLKFLMCLRCTPGICVFNKYQGWFLPSGKFRKHW